MYINLGPVGRYLTTFRAARVIFKNYKIYSIFGTAALGPYGRQPMVAQKTLSPIISAWYVTGNLILRKSQNKLLHLRPSMCENISPKQLRKLG